MGCGREVHGYVACGREGDVNEVDVNVADADGDRAADGCAGGVSAAGKSACARELVDLHPRKFPPAEGCACEDLRPASPQNP